LELPSSLEGIVFMYAIKLFLSRFSPPNAKKYSTVGWGGSKAKAVGLGHAHNDKVFGPNSSRVDVVTKALVHCEAKNSRTYL